MAERIVILGGGYAGALAAARLWRQLRRERHAVVLIDASPGLVERVRLHESSVSGKTFSRSFKELFRRTSIEILQARVSRIDLDQRTLDATASDGRPIAIAYSKLVIATGSTIDVDRVPGVTQHAHTLAGHRDTQLLHGALRTFDDGALVTVCGAGLTGIETATEIAEMFPHLGVRVVDVRQLGAGLSPRGRSVVAGAFDRLGIRFEEGYIERVNRESIALSGGRAIPHDLVVWCGPLRAMPLADVSGLTTNEQGQVPVDETFRTQYEGVYAIGDAATMSWGPVALRMACATAQPMGAHVADVIAGELCGDVAAASAPFDFKYVAQCVSLGRNSGLVQFVDENDRPVDRVVRGRLAAWVKKEIVRYTVRAIKLQLLGIPYSWPRGGRKERTDRDRSERVRTA